ncbi:MAG: transposase [Nocardioidaceae bacterium]
MSSSIPGLPGTDDDVVDPAGTTLDPSARPFRRTFTAEYRARVVAEYEAAPHGEKSAVLRREGLYQSQVRRWAAARDALARGTSAPRRGHRAAGGADDPARLRAENQRLARELAKSQAVVEIMGKLQGLLESVSESTDTMTSSRRR